MIAAVREAAPVPYGVQVIEKRSDGYPGGLGDLEEPPKRLYAIGDPSTLAGAPDRLVAIVGTRDASPYGIRTATSLAAAFARAGIVVVSGMARGIDSAAHEGALAAGGKTVAVLGTGVDVPYPVGNRSLHQRVARQGVVLSESPPGTLAFQGCFPRRNRIIAALAKVVIVVEAPFKSGAMNTASQHQGLGRHPAAVPGPIDSPRSGGSNLLIRDGAYVIASIEDALGLYGLAKFDADPKPLLGRTDTLVWDALAAGDGSVEEVAGRAGLTVRQTLESVARLELAGLARESESGRIERLSVV